MSDTLRVLLRPTKRTDVMCISCFKFQCERVVMRADGGETDVGVHNRCERGIGHKFTRERRSKRDEVDEARRISDKMETPC